MPSVFPGPWTDNSRTLFCNFTHQPIAQASGATAVPATTINTFNQWMVNGCYFEQYNTTASTAAMPTMGTITNNGLNIDTITGAAAKTIEITTGNSTGGLLAFASRSLPFFVRATFNVNTLANVTSLRLGFRKQQAYNATETNYTDYATFGISGAAGHLQALTQLASGGVTTTDSGNVAVALTNFTVQINVDGSGNVTYLRDVTGNGPLIAPTTVVAYQFGAALTLIPYLYYTTVTSHTEVDLVSFACGYL